MSNELEVVLFPCLSDNYGILIHDNASGETVSIDTPEVDKIEATYADGILSLNIPKREEAKPKPARKITIG